MCGINGILLSRPGDTVDPAMLQQMVSSLRHRGPDAQGQFVDGPVGLGHTRLAILDLSPRAAQPMNSADGRAVIAFNGEIYNFRELRSTLETRGAVFRSQSDTEVILQAWLCLGPACLERIEGMFALALWDRQQQTLLLARDRLGVKPLFYAWTPHGLVFGSEIKALRPFLSSIEIEECGFQQVLLFGAAASPGSLIRGVKKLPAAHAFLVRVGEEPRPRAYWRPGFAPPQCATGIELRDQLRERLAAAVRRQLVSDVPVGAFLSGGLDSSILVSLMTREFPEKVNTFSVGGRGFAESELPFARLMADRLGVRHHPVEIDRADFLAALPDVAWHNDEPTADPALVPLYFLSRHARQQVTVVLCGEGADEVFAGYAHYPDARERMRRLQALRRWPAAVRLGALGMIGLLRGPGRAVEMHSLVRNLERDPFAVAQRPPERVERHVAGMVTDPSLLRRAKVGYRELLAGQALVTSDPLEATLRVDLLYNLADFLLMRADNMTMSAGLEARVPFLDEQVVEFATRLPGEEKLHGARSKAILRDVFGSLLPREILQRPKAPFPVPLAQWVLEDAHLLARVLLQGSLVARGLLRPKPLRRFIEAASAKPGRTDRWDCILAWRLLYLETWARRVVDNQAFSLAA